MQTITLQIDDNVSDKFLWLLNHFSQSEVQIIEKNSTFEPHSSNEIASLGGSLSHYANPSNRTLEDQAWELHIADKYQ